MVIRLGIHGSEAGYPQNALRVQIPEVRTS